MTGSYRHNSGNTAPRPFAVNAYGRPINPPGFWQRIFNSWRNVTCK